MHKRRIYKALPLFMAAALLLTGCGSRNTPDIQEILQSTQEPDSTEAGDEAVSDAAGEPEAEADTQNVGSAQDQVTEESTADTADKPENTICIFVCGEVVTPGVYYFAEGARKVDAVEAAGGFTDEANTDYVNLAELLTDEMQLYIPAVGEETDAVGTGAALTEAEAVNAGKINLNTASVSELCELSGIGESKAQAILQYREEHGGFETVEELTQVSGIGESTLEKIRDYIYVE